MGIFPIYFPNGNLKKFPVCTWQMRSHKSDNLVHSGESIYFYFPCLEEAQELTKRITTPYMTKYERARVLGTRALQIR